MIDAKSRYVNGRIVPLQDQTVMVVRRFPRPDTEYRYYTWVINDRMDTVAAKFLAGPWDWWKIMDHNPFIQDPTEIRPGQQVRIPINA